MRFQRNNIGVVAGIEKAFLQVSLLPLDEDVTYMVEERTKECGEQQPENFVFYKNTVWYIFQPILISSNHTQVFRRI